MPQRRQHDWARLGAENTVRSISKSFITESVLLFVRLVPAYHVQALTSDAVEMK